MGRAGVEPDDHRRARLPAPRARARPTTTCGGAWATSCSPRRARTAAGGSGTPARPTCRRRPRPTTPCGSAASPPPTRAWPAPARWCSPLGGVNRARFFTKLWLAVLGRYPWTALPVLPPEMILLPPRAPMSPYRFASWARGTFVALMVVLIAQPDLPAAGGPRRAVPRAPRHGAVARARRRRAAWTPAAHPQPDAGAPLQPAPHPPAAPPGRGAGGPLDLRAPGGRRLVGRHPAALGLLDLRPARAGLPARPPGHRSAPWPGSTGPSRSTSTTASACASRRACRRSGTRRSRRSRSPTRAPRPDDPALASAADWLLSKEVTRYGDWHEIPRRGRPGGWSFEFANEYYPDTDDTAEVLIALRRAGHPPSHPAVRRGVDWLLAMQSANGGWGSFDVDNDHAVMTQIPLCDFGEVIDPPTEDVTAHVVEALVECGLPREPPGGAPGRRLPVAHPARRTGPGGGAGASTTSTAPAPRCRRSPRPARTWATRASAGPSPGWPATRTATAAGARASLSYGDPEWIGRGDSTASQTAWALLGLLAADPAHAAVEGGLAYLARTQRADGSWDEPWFTGTGFPMDFMINYHLYRQVFPVTALGRAAAVTARGLARDAPPRGRRPGPTTRTSPSRSCSPRADVRADMRAVYAFCRATDDLGDEGARRPGRAPRRARRLGGRPAPGGRRRAAPPDAAPGRRWPTRSRAAAWRSTPSCA